jgi:glycine betaine/proline transport system substrate-binding protein
VFDLPKYWKLFKDPENPNKGRFHNSIPGWQCTKTNSKKLKVYGLDKYFTDFMPGSDPALAGSIAAAYKKGKAWVGYYWAPTWVLGFYDMTPLKEPSYDPKVWKTTKGCAYGPFDVNILVNSGFQKEAPEIIEFLKNYKTSTAQNNKFLAYMRESKSSTQDAAIWFLKKYESTWTEWVSPEMAKKVKAALP